MILRLTIFAELQLQTDRQTDIQTVAVMV